MTNAGSSPATDSTIFMKTKKLLNKANTDLIYWQKRCMAAENVLNAQDNQSRTRLDISNLKRIWIDIKSLLK